MEPPVGPAAGKAYFAQVGCLTCHRVGSEGGATGPDLTLVGFRQNAQWLDRFLADPQAWKPDTLMPRTMLSPAARSSIVAYLTSLQGLEWAAHRPWDSKEGSDRGRMIYLRAGCVACHGAGGIGGYPNNNVRGGKIPALNTVSETYTKTELIPKISRGVPAPEKEDTNGPDPLVVMPRWQDKLSGPDVEAVATYLLTFTPGEDVKTDW